MPCAPGGLTLVFGGLQTLPGGNKAFLMFSKPLFFLAAVAIGIGAAGCASLVDNRAEQIILGELPRLVGPARAYRVDARGVVPAAGRLQAVRVVGERIARPGSPVIDKAEVSLRDVRFDRSEKRVESIGAVDASARILAADIATFLDTRSGLDAVEVQFFGGNEIAVSALPSVAGLRLPAQTRVTMRGVLVPDGPLLKLEIVDLRAAGVEVGLFARAALQALVNPIVDLSSVPAPSQISSARVEGAALVIEASGVSSVAASTAAGK